jgi:hypothetical protein
MKPKTEAALLADAGFSEQRERAPYRLMSANFGQTKAGKSHWTIITTPAPVAVLSFDTGTAEIVAKARAMGRRVLHREIRIPRPLAKMTATERAEQCAAGWDECRRAVDAIIAAKFVRTWVVDTETEMCELGRLAHFGKLSGVKPHHYVEINSELRSLIKGTYDERPDLNIILVRKLKKEYRESKKTGEGVWTGGYEPGGFGDVPYLVDLSIEHFFEDGVFGVRVPEVKGNCGCRFGSHMIGFELPGEADLPCDFPTLAVEAVPGSKEEDWR